MAAPYFHSRSEYDAFGIDIIKKNGIIYLEIVDRKEVLNQNECNTSDEVQGPSWWGRRFENICRSFPMKQTEEKKENESKDATENPELITVFASELNAHKLLIAAEMDAVNDDMKFVEIKTQKYIVPKTKKYQQSNRYNNRNYQNKNGQSISYSPHKESIKGSASHRYHPYQNKQTQNAADQNNNDSEKIIPYYKSIKIWIQSFLGGVNNILIGFRNEKGMVVDVEMFKLEYFAKKLNSFNKRKQQRVFKGNICLNFTDKVLTFIKENCKSEDCVYRVVFNAPWKQLILYAKPKENSVVD